MAFFMAKNNDNLILMSGVLLGVFALSIGTKKALGNELDDNKGSKLPYDGKPSTFIQKNYPYALQAQRLYPKVPVELPLIQSGLEANWGKSAPGNNFFGYKAFKNWKGQKQLLKTTEILPSNTGYNFPEVLKIEKLPSGKYRWTVKDWFRAYPTPLHSYLDYLKLITSGRYADNYKKGDINAIIEEIAKDGYATDPNYANKLKSLVPKVREYIRSFT